MKYDNDRTRARELPRVVCNNYTAHGYYKLVIISDALSRNMNFLLQFMRRDDIKLYISMHDTSRMRTLRIGPRFVDTRIQFFRFSSILQNFRIFAINKNVFFQYVQNYINIEFNIV